MTESDRIKLLRKEKLNLTMEKFGEALGISKAAISRIESGIVTLTDQNRRSICREFNVSERWLRTGEGEPFIKKSRSEEIFEYVERIRGVNDNFKAQFAAALTALEEEDWKIILDVVNDIKEKSLAEKRKAEPKVVPEPSVITDLSPEEQELIRQLREKRKQKDA